MLCLVSIYWFVSTHNAAELIASNNIEADVEPYECVNCMQMFQDRAHKLFSLNVYLFCEILDSER